MCIKERERESERDDISSEGVCVCVGEIVFVFVRDNELENVLKIMYVLVHKVIKYQY